MKRLWAHIFVLSAVSISASLLQASYQVQLTPKPNPPDVGENTLEIQLNDEDGKAVTDVDLELLVYMPAMGTMPRMEEKAAIKPTSLGRFIATYSLSMAGSWEVTLTVHKNSKIESFAYSLTTLIPRLVNKTAKRSSNEGDSSVDVLSIGPERLQKIGVKFSETKIISRRKN